MPQCPFKQIQQNIRLTLMFSIRDGLALVEAKMRNNNIPVLTFFWLLLASSTILWKFDATIIFVDFLCLPAYMFD